MGTLWGLLPRYFVSPNIGSELKYHGLSQERVLARALQPLEQSDEEADPQEVQYLTIPSTAVV